MTVATISPRAAVVSEHSPLLHGSFDGKEAPADAEKGQPSSSPSATAFLGASFTTVAILYYAACSSSMLIINKVAIHHLPAPTFLLFCQLASSAFAVKSGALLGVLEVDSLQWDKVKRFGWVIVGFLGTIFCNIKVLQHTNVETFITFRATTPIVLSVCDYLFLGRTLPNTRSWACLFTLVLGALGYVLTDTGFDMGAYTWLGLWYVLFTFDTVYVKHMCESIKMTSWGRVYYTNAIALLPLMLALPALKEHEKLQQMVWSSQMVVPLVLSCLVGVCMSHSAYLLRDAVSATMFTIVGILCKVLTVIANCLLWDKHASAEGIACLLLCVLAGTFYQQAPKRETSSQSHYAA